MATWTQDDIDTLKAALRTGVLTVKYSGPPAREIQYQSLASMRALLAEMIADVGSTNGTRPHRRLAKTTKGF